MRICHVVRQYYPSVGGMEAFVAALASSLSKIGCSNDVLTLDRVFLGDDGPLPEFEHVHGVNVRRVPMIGHRRFFLPLIPDDAFADYDVIHVHGLDGMFDRVARYRPGPRQVLAATSHGLFFHTPWMTPVKEFYLRTATRLAAARYDLLIANSASDAVRLRTIAGDVVHLHNGVTPLGSFQATGRDLLCLGRLARHKHVERLIAALAEPALTGVILHIVGPEWDVSRLEVAQWAEQFGVSDRVRIYGRVNDKVRADIARHCALFVSASSYEGFGMSMIEAMSVGLIPVVHANEAFVELVDAADCGALVDFTKPYAAASIIRKHLDQIDDAQRLHAAKFAERFSWSGHAEKTLALYREARGDRVHRAA